ncbi:PIR protein [Plasmodium ovale]|uniref:PIR protein n=1 Tax=Plasmodium ovale TaxID=36330 RepID=A0A1D3JG87_PLAOA|nr:PIR protein [Plasmodium ovale]
MLLVLFHLQYPDLGHLPSHELNNAMNNNENFEAYSYYCKSIENTLPKYKEICELCSKVARNLSYLEDMRTNDTSFFNKHCYDLSYWLYDYVYNYLNYGEINEYFDRIIEQLHAAWTNVSNDISDKPEEQCLPQIIDFNNKHVKSIKVLNDYVENYCTIKESMNEKGEDQKYCKYLIDTISQYHTFEELCKSKEEYGCKQLIEDYNKYNPIFLLSKLSCNVNDNLQYSHYANLLTQTLEPHNLSPNDMLESIVKSLNTYNTSPILLFLKKIFNSSNFDLTAIGGLSFVGIFIIFFILYKYTPFSPLLRSCMCKKRMSKHNTEQDEAQNVSYENSESCHMTKHKMEHLLAYHTITKNS